MDEDEEEEIPLDMEVRSCFQTERWSSFFVKDVEAVSKKARQDDDLGTEHLQVREAVLLVVFWKLIDEM